MFLASEERGPMEFLETPGGGVSDPMKVDLSQDYTFEEIESALKQMHPTKAPSLDSMPPLFYQKYWVIVGPTISKALLHVLNSG